MTEHRFCQVVTTVDARAAAEALARTAVTARLAACAQIVGPITSIYRWRGAIETAEEWQVVFKTTTERYPALEEHLRTEHHYEVPEILCLPVTTGNPPYLAWLATEVEGS